MDQQKPDTIYVQPAQAANGLAVAAFVLGIIGLVLFFIPVIPYPLAILAIIFGGIAARTRQKGFCHNRHCHRNRNIGHQTRILARTGYTFLSANSRSVKSVWRKEK